MEPQTNWSGIISSLTRFLLGGLMVGLVAKGVITKDQAEFIMAAVAAGVIAIGVPIWIWIRAKAQAKLEQTQIKVALRATPDTPVAAVKYEAKQIVAEGESK